MNLRKPILITIAFLTNVALMGVVLAAGLRRADPAKSSADQDKSPKEQLHGVLSSARLTPALRGVPHQVRFSSDGEHLVVQVESGIYILSRRPLEIQTWIYAPDILPARFSADSKTLILATRSLAISQWNLVDNRRVAERILKKEDGCLASELSPNGDLAACLDPSLALELYRTDTGERVFGEQVLADQDKMAAGLASVGLILRNERTAYAEPFGYGISDAPRSLTDRGIFGARFLFSPDAHFLLMLDRRHSIAVCVDATARRKIGCPAIIKGHMNAAICFVAPNELAVLDPDNPDHSRIAEFPGGKFVSNLHLAARAAAPATQSKYLIVRGSDNQSEVRLFDWDAGRTLRAQEKAQMDFSGQTLAIYSQQGELSLIHLPEDKLEAKTNLPPPLLPSLHTANVSPSLDAIVLGVGGDAGLFRTATGNQVMPFTRLSGTWFAGDDELYIAASREDGSPGMVKKVNLHAETVAETWAPTFKSDPRFTILDTHFGGPVLFVLEQSALYVFPDGHVDYPGHQRRSKLRALDLKSGRELWSGQWQNAGPQGDRVAFGWRDALPVPYADPQGDRVALGWRATMSGGQALAERYPALKRQLDAAKLTINDVVFETLEAVSGKSLGAVLVRVGWGPESFDSVFSVGDFLICVRDEARVTVYSLSTGEIQARLFGHYVSASGATGLLAAADGNHLRLFSLKSGSKVDEYLFPDAPVYTRFSTAGNRLLVLTAKQVAYVIDVDPLRSSTRNHASGSLSLHGAAQ